MRNMFPRVMKSAAAALAILTAALIGIYRFYPCNAVLTVAISCGTACYHFAMRLLVGALVPPIKGTSRWFRPRRWEASLYRLLGVKNWKRWLPTYDPRQFSLTENTVRQMVRNMCGAEVVHEVIMVCSFLPLLMVPVFGEFWIFFITSMLAALFDSLFVMAQRYNRPRLERIVQKGAAYERIDISR